MSTKVKFRTSRQEFIAQNRKFLADRWDSGQKTLIAYVRDEWGQKKGAVVALGPDQIGWSLVHQTKDIFFVRSKPGALPVVQTLMRDIAALEKAFANTGDVSILGEILVPKTKLVDILTKFAIGSPELRPGIVKAYKFDREKGLHSAFKRASAFKWTGKKDPSAKDFGAEDADVIATIQRVLDRQERFFAAKPKAVSA